MNLYCNINCCPYGGLCGNALVESDKIYLGKNVRTKALGVVAAEDIEASEILGQYLGEMEHVSASRANRPRNNGNRLVMKLRPERPTQPNRVAINAEKMGGLMRFVNHSCEPLAKFAEVSNGRRSTVVVASMQDIRQGEEVTVDYGDDLWCICRCRSDGCRHRHMQDAQDPRRHREDRETGGASETKKRAYADRCIDMCLGKDEWERLAMSYNSTRQRVAPERDFESLRRKFKVLYSMWKPTGVQERPPHIKKAKEVKLAIDAKANVVVMDDEVDDDQPDFCFEVDPDDTFYEDIEDDNNQSHVNDTVARSTDGESPGSDKSVKSMESKRPTSRGEFQAMLNSPQGIEGLDDLARTPRPTPGPVARRTGSGASLPPRRAAASTTSGGASLEMPQQSSQAGSAVSSDDLEAAKYPKLQTFSNRLGGADLSSFRDTVNVKLAREGDKDTVEASYAKAKRIRAMKATTALRSKLDSLENSASSMRGSILETLLVLREESERKADTRRAEEEQRRRDEKTANEAHLIEGKAEAEARRREEKLEREDRARRDREDARARTQELLLLIGALTKKA
ncbi:unnamed protein product [Phytophthora fragariaefolia]|uniref:Unnamed protein product n=1 Tax=Phytophthora fragariaefolia TaxID=1490495 RepID=A0A9W7D219_9STRA|nr:unnamed protein product [Phytophthora fragariaefolia]